jgi:glucose/arabinose dehydrogenase
MHLAIAILSVLLQQAPASSTPPESLPVPSIRLARMYPGLSLRRPVQALQAPGDDRHLYVLEQAGRILKLDLEQPSGVEPAVWMDIREQVHSHHNEEGLLSMAFHPRFAENRRLYLYYSANRPLRTELTEFTVDATTGRPDIGSARVILEIGQPWGNHNGGTALFGRDGMLYLSTGDGGAANDPQGHAQNLGSLLGKVLRLDVDHRLQDRAYGVPKDNPFVEVPGARPEVWAYGLRNVWRMSFDRATGRLYGGDVGQNAFEEVDIIEKGGNYGWNPREGFHAFGGGKPGAFGADYRDPIAEYPRSEGVSVTGGFVYRGTRLPALQGVYLYADYAFGTIWGIRCGQSRCGDARVVWRRRGQNSMWSSFGELNSGELVLCAFDGGESGPGSLWRIEATE